MKPFYEQKVRGTMNGIRLTESELTAYLTRGNTAAGLGEKAFMGEVIKLAQLFGWLCYHTHDSRRSAEGFPDLTLVRAGRLVFVELKSEKGKLTAAQQAWLSALGGCGAETYLWRPNDVESVVKVLR